MVSKRDDYQQHYLHCRGLADTTVSPEVRALWLSVADSYRVLVDFEDSFPNLDGKRLRPIRERSAVDY